MRFCVEEKEIEGKTVKERCPHFYPTKHKACGLLGKGFTPSKKTNEQKYCPIAGGIGGKVEFNYHNLLKYDPSPAWAKIIENMRNKRSESALLG